MASVAALASPRLVCKRTSPSLVNNLKSGTNVVHVYRKQAHVVATFKSQQSDYHCYHNCFIDCHPHFHKQRNHADDLSIQRRNLSSIGTSKIADSPIVHKGYTTSKLSYFRGWAYQQVYLNRRLNYKREKNHNAAKKIIAPTAAGIHNNDHISDTNDDRDRILFFEHEPVYTLGRGAKEHYLTFLSEEDRQLLSRRNNRANSPSSTAGSSKLYMDKLKMRQAHHCNNLDEEYSIQDEVNSMGAYMLLNIELYENIHMDYI